MLDRLHAASPESRVVATGTKPEPDPEHPEGLVEQLRIRDLLDRGEWLLLDGPPVGETDRDPAAAQPAGRLDRLRANDPDAYRVLHALYWCQAVLRLHGRTKQVIQRLVGPQSASGAAGVDRCLERLVQPCDGGAPLVQVDHQGSDAVYSISDEVLACLRARESP
jgi:hypothetical protein